MRSTFCGTPLYFSPELLTGQVYDEKVDVWAIGIMLFELVFGTSPFNLKQPQDLTRIVKIDIIIGNIGDRISKK
jgi:serine/threonine protein kinase